MVEMARQQVANMSGYSAGRRYEAHGAVTRVVIGLSPERVRQSSTATLMSVAREQERYLTLPKKPQRDEKQPPDTARLPHGGRNRSTVARHDIAVTTDVVHTRQRQFDEHQRPAVPASAVVQHVNHADARRQINNVVITSINQSNI